MTAREYEAPLIEDLGTVEEITMNASHPGKHHAASGDFKNPGGQFFTSGS